MELRLTGISVSLRTIVIDVGKTFLPAALEWFPKYGLRRIDAVLITHAHADGMLSSYVYAKLAELLL